MEYGKFCMAHTSSFLKNGAIARFKIHVVLVFAQAYPLAVEQSKISLINGLK
jgi:hypothetical protein